MTDIFDDLFDEAEALTKVSVGTSSELSTLVRALRRTDKEIEDAEDTLKKLREHRQKLTTELIPGLMDQMGVERLDVDGVTVVRRLIVSASIPEAKRAEAFDWLRDNHLDDIIKNDVALSFGKGQDNMAKDLVEFLREHGFDPEIKTHIHPMTLKAFVRERIEAGKPIDLDMFGAFVVNAAEIKRK